MKISGIDEIATADEEKKRNGKKSIWGKSILFCSFFLFYLLIECRDGGMEGWRHGGMDGWMDGWINNILTYFLLLLLQQHVATSFFFLSFLYSPTHPSTLPHLPTPLSKRVLVFPMVLVGN